MKIHHIAIWTFQLEEMKEFYTRYFNGSSNEKYIKPPKKDSNLISFTSRRNGFGTDEPYGHTEYPY